MCQTKEKSLQAKYATEIAGQFKNYDISSVVKDVGVTDCCWQDILIFVLSLIALFCLIVVTLVCLVQDCLKGEVSCGSILAIMSVSLILAFGIICPMRRCFRDQCGIDAAKIAEAHYRFATTYIVEMTRLYKEQNVDKNGDMGKDVMENSKNITVNICNGDTNSMD